MSAAATAVTAILCGTEHLFLKIIPPVLVIFGIMNIAAGHTAKSITKKITDPLKSVDLKRAGEADVCEELKPFLERIDTENLVKAQTEKMRREFSANVSHELKTPHSEAGGHNNLYAKN